jgi:hypothetical protein
MDLYLHDAGYAVLDRILDGDDVDASLLQQLERGV